MVGQKYGLCSGSGSDAPFRSGNNPAYRNVWKELKEGSREAGTSSALRGTLTVTTPSKGTGSVYHLTPPA